MLQWKLNCTYMTIWASRICMTFRVLRYKNYNLKAYKQIYVDFYYPVKLWDLTLFRMKPFIKDIYRGYVYDRFSQLRKNKSIYDY